MATYGTFVMVRWGFCHGWYLDGNFCEVMCRNRERCAYYDVDFYRKHGDHLDDFDEMFPQEPCQFFVESSPVRKPVVEDAFQAFVGG